MDPTRPLRAPTNDDALITAAQRGERQAVEQLLRRHYDRIYAVCRRITGNDADAADAAQESMIAIVRAIGRFDGRASFGTWAYRIATNASLDELRRRRRRPVTGLPAPDDVAPDPTGEARLDAVTERDALDAALARLPEEFRVAVVLRDVGDLDYAEIAEVLDVPAGTVRSRISRGRAILVERLGPAAAGPARSGNPVPASERQNDDG